MDQSLAVKVVFKWSRLKMRASILSRWIRHAVRKVVQLWCRVTNCAKPSIVYY